MAITAADVKFKLSIKTGSVGNSLSQADPNASLGKYISTTEITVIDKDETVKVNAQDLEKSDTGKYYYEVQTLSSWITGRYSATVVSTGTPPDTTTNPRCFFLL